MATAIEEAAVWEKQCEAHKENSQEQSLATSEATIKKAVRYYDMGYVDSTTRNPKKTREALIYMAARS